MKIKIIFILVLGVIIIIPCSVSLAQAPKGKIVKTPKATAVTPVAQEASRPEAARPSTNVPDDPHIREFLVTPINTMPNSIINISWRVEPLISPISTVHISCSGLGLNVNSSDPTGNYNFTIPAGTGNGRYQITITATNTAGRTTTARIVEINVLRELNLRVTRLWTNPEEFTEGQRVEFHVGTNVNEGDSLNGLTVIITRDGREVSRLGPFDIGRGGMLTTYGRTVSIAPAYPGTYQVELHCGDQVSRSEFRTESITRYKFPSTR